jgi:hypothetical protein
MRENYYVGYEVGWETKTCPKCKQRPATAHGFLHKEPPSAPGPDERIPVGEVFIHDSGEDCTVLAASERPPAAG